MSKTFALLQARVRSSRLPGKVLASLQGTSIIEIVVERLKRSEELDGIILLTSNEPENDALAYIVSQHNIPCYRGSENDVLDRYYQGALCYDVSHIVRITGDCPLIDPEIVDSVIRLYHQSDADLVSNQLSESFPDGLDVCVFSFNALEAAWKNAQLTSEREHVVPWIIKNSQINGGSLFKARDYPCTKNLSDQRWTIDEASDYIFLKELTKVLPVSIINASYIDILNILEKYPEIKNINSNNIRNEGYQKSLVKDTIV